MQGVRTVTCSGRVHGHVNKVGRNLGFGRGGRIVGRSSLLHQTDHVNVVSSGLRLGRLLQDCGLINEHQLMEAQAACGGRLGAVLIKRGCLTQEQLASVLETQDAIRASSLALDMSVIVGNSGPSDVGGIGFAVTLTKTEVEHSMPFPGPPVRAHQSLLADISRDLSIKAISAQSDGFCLKGDDGSSIPYRVSVGTGFSETTNELQSDAPLHLAAASGAEDRLKLELRVDPADLRAVPTGRFCDTLQVVLA